jgi:hypothetical protein
MARPAEDFLLKKDVKSPYWHYRLKGVKSFKSTGQKTKAAAKSFTLLKWKELQDSGIKKLDMKFGNFTKGFFLWDSPWCTSQDAKRKLQITTAEWRQGMLSHHIDPLFQNKLINDITPGTTDSWILILIKKLLPCNCN